MVVGAKLAPPHDLDISMEKNRYDKERRWVWEKRWLGSARDLGPVIWI